ncbi:MAG TPA: tripartite tricarboxylate transporter substrate binding protein [Burkholderiales bacterium]|nr:tripartite tricarboxylate transporter substrate binding protein [Burkholderiales bacterium]
MPRIFCLLAAIAFCCVAQAQSDYPNKPVRLITPFNPGGAIDIYSRTIGEPLGRRLGQNIIVEAIAGANTISGTQQLVRATPDGYTFMITTMSTTVNNRILFTNLPYNPDRDLAPITQLSYGTVLFVGPGNAPYSDLKSFIAWAKTKDRVTYGSWGIASWGHLAGQILKRDLGLNLEHVPYKGDVPAITDVQNGALDTTFTSPTSAKPRIASGAIKAIAMTGPQRSAAMPELATFTEQGVPNVDLAIWVGAYAPAGTPRAIIDRLQRELKAVINLPEVRERMIAQGQTPVGNTPEEFAANVKADLPKWDALIKASGAKIE